MMTTSYKFRKAERLHSLKSIELLFAEGQSFHSFPFRVVWMKVNQLDKSQAAMAISVPKKNFKKAVHRNRIKRLVRESYRLQKQGLYSFLLEKQTKVVFMLLYTHKEELDYKSMFKRISATLLRLQKEIELVS